MNPVAAAERLQHTEKSGGNHLHKQITFHCQKADLNKNWYRREWSPQEQAVQGQNVAVIQ